MPTKRYLLQKFLKGIETGDAMSAAVVDEARYVQHNPQTGAGGEGIAALFARLSRTDPKVRFRRVFEDGDFAFAHIEYDFSSVRIAFEVFRFDGDRAIEHWDNIQSDMAPNSSGRRMTDGETRIIDLEKTEENRKRATDFVEAVLIPRQYESLGRYVDASIVQHAPDMADGIEAMRRMLLIPEPETGSIRYQWLHRVLAEGNFVLCVCEGIKSGAHSGIYDLYRLKDGSIVEHWNTIETIPARELWKNNNGKF